MINFLQSHNTKNASFIIFLDDSTRVKLTPTSQKDPESDYINASLVKVIPIMSLKQHSSIIDKFFLRVSVVMLNI